MTQLKKEDEVVIVVNRNKLFKNGELQFQGVTSDARLVDSIMYHLDMYYKSMRRGSVEEVDTPVSKNAELNFDYKQPIPYIVIRRGENEFFVTERLQGGGESRLHGKLAMGAGGHINPLSVTEDEPFEIVLEENIKRELEEELDISRKVEIKPIGLINDDSDNTGKVHIGILGIIDLDVEATVAVKEVEQLAGHWMTLDELKSKEVYDRLENWGKIVVDLLGR
ncbi:NUDIX domain-containing protein [Bacillus sp. S0628]|uniref:NUDIX domain-containing protein n=1 Tax=Bacillus sp. S0628 TaxID=2957802 RepID=UPI00209D97DB|nr:NUDIX domain-containing protein [Bacillus sp. S0628]MCP1324309.1 NUDIX domain-containing protein [Bacillus sp. S0628]